MGRRRDRWRNGVSKGKVGGGNRDGKWDGMKIRRREGAQDGGMGGKGG